ncbi:MAG: biotin/lipoyl-containing protein [Candidatus Kariarchaeaceae archaeon]
MKQYKTYVDDVEATVDVENGEMTVGDYKIHVKEQLPHGMMVDVNGKDQLIDDIIALPDEGIVRVEIKGYTIDVKVIDPISEALSGSGKDSGDVDSPMAGTVSAIKVKVGDKVQQGDVLLVISAMKMENQISSPITGIVQDIKVNNNEQVPAGKLLIVVQASE